MKNFLDLKRVEKGTFKILIEYFEHSNINAIKVIVDKAQHILNNFDKSNASESDILINKRAKKIVKNLSNKLVT